MAHKDNREFIAAHVKPKLKKDLKILAKKHELSLAKTIILMLNLANKSINSGTSTLLDGSDA